MQQKKYIHYGLIWDKEKNKAEQEQVERVYIRENFRNSYSCKWHKPVSHASVWEKGNCHPESSSGAKSEGSVHVLRWQEASATWTNNAETGHEAAQ